MRTQQQQTKHDRKVEEIARSIIALDVRADLKDWNKPPKIGNHIPDVYAVSGLSKYVVEVETPETDGVGIHKEQEETFKGWENQSSFNHFTKVITT